MFNELWFIPFGNQRLAGMRKPKNTNEVRTLKAHHVAAIISLLDDQTNHDIYQAGDMPFLWLPITGGTAMTAEQAHTAYDYVVHTLADNTNATVAVHCSNGHKRTGMVLAALQILHGVSADAALRHVIENNTKAQAMNEAQRTFLMSLQKP